MLNSLPIIQSKYLEKKVKRSWKERLFAFPWTPFKKYKFVPYDRVLVMDDPKNINGKVIICHPKYYNKVKEAIEIKGGMNVK